MTPGEEPIEVNQMILDLEPGDPVATNRLGICLINAARFDEAVEVLVAGVALHPGNEIMRNRLEQARKKQGAVKGTPLVSTWHMPPDELVDRCLAGPGRAACIELCAESIRTGRQLDTTRLAVTPIKAGSRFRVIGGIFTGVAPWKENLCVAVPVAHRSVIDRVEAAGGWIENEPPKGLPTSCNLAIPRAVVEGLVDVLLPSHFDHLKASIAAGVPTHASKQSAELEAFLLAEAPG